ncbi:hypothetical protein IQ255_09720 [Pleurocapsales cyanobacterium LEGE 10410]|nr:hypothetical protein [Pleurocapsales cyanobacterium LEGE 10410]
MNILQSGIEVLGNVGFGVIKNSGRLLYGSGQTVIGIVSENDELTEQGVKNLGRGAMGLTIHAAKEIITGDSHEDELENDDIDLDYYE